MVARAGHLPVGRIGHRAAADLHLVRGADDRLRHAGVAAVEFVDEVDGLIAVDVGEGRALGREVGVHELLGHGDLGTVGRRIVIPAGFVEGRKFLAVFAAEDHLLRQQPGAGEQRAVGGLHVARHEREGTFVHDLLGCRGGFAQELVVGVVDVVLPRLVGRRLARMVLAEGAFVERGAGLHGAGGVFAQAVERVARPVVGQVRDGAVEVLHDLLHHESAAVARPFERSPVVRRNHEVVIGDVAVFAHLFEVEQRAEEIGHAVVALADRLVGAVARTFEVVVDVTQVGPCACAPVFGGRGARALLYGAEVLGDLDVGDLNGIGVGTCEETVEAVGPKLQLRFARKERIGRKVRFRLLGQEVVAARQRQTHRNEYQYFADSFHG